MASNIGKVGWVDLTVDNAEEIRDFYSTVVGFKAEDVDMGEYSDFNMCVPDTGEAAAGVCHARGANAEQPGGWLVYFIVADIDSSARACTEAGGKLLVAPRGAGGGRFCVIEDPAGAVAALFQE